jgi:asparagine synthase (glutamine-hydrolysing)
MCGINGLLHKDTNTEIKLNLQVMNNLIIHRGPDDDGSYIYQNKLAMGMRRLSIIDLSSGNQPMFNETSNLVIVFNGEIYNYKELKSTLENQGVIFKTNSDTEVVLKSYEIYGAACLNQLNGMFAFAIHDKSKNSVFIARDRFGEKPLYYHHNSEIFVWASELKSITKVFPKLKIIRKESLTTYFVLTYIPAPHTIYQDIHKLPPGHYLNINTETLRAEIKEYWDVPKKTVEDRDIKYDTAKRKIEDLLFQSVEQRMISDVPLGVFLSGGVDSSIIAAIMGKVHNKNIDTFSLGYQNKKYDESARASLVAKHIGANHHSYILDFEELNQEIDKIILNYDEPFADSSCLPTYFIAKKAAQNVKVALTGDGGDEVFGGYNKYLSLQYRNWYLQFTPSFARKTVEKSKILQNLRISSTKSLGAKIKKFLNSLNDDITDSHLNILAMGFQQSEIEKLLNPQSMLEYRSFMRERLGDISEKKNLKLLRYIDTKISLEGDMLVKVDRASMLCSLECRTPFLDHNLMEYSYQLPDNFLLKGNNKKRILKDTFEHLLPKNFFNAQKSGFEIPINDWFKTSLKTELIETLSEENLNRHQLLNNNYVALLITEHLNTKVDHSRKLWTIFCFQKWYNRNFN